MKMNICKNTTALFLTVLSAFSCGDLNLDESIYHTKKYQFSDFSQVKEVMTNVYGYIESGFYDFQECATDDAVFAPSPDTMKTYYDGSWSANNLKGDRWKHYYAGIRAANYLLENCPEDFENARWNENYKYYLEQLRNYPWEAKTLRAYFHFELLKRYNSIIIADRTFTPQEVGDLFPVTYREAAEWIASELKEAAEKLPDTYSGTYYSEVGRVTKAFALALRSRVLLYNASPLNNTSNDRKKYEAAAIAANDFIRENSKKNRFALTRTVYNKDNSQDVIFCLREGSSNTFERNNFPVGFEGANGGMCPTLNLVEAFDMLDGTPFDYSRDRDALLDPSKRDPRLARSILSNGDQFKGMAIETFRGGANGKPKENASPTSFYLRKFLQEQTSLTIGRETSSTHVYPIIRIQEVYLNYAEALFEATGQPGFKGTLSGTSFTMSPVEAVNAVRKVYGMPELPSGIDAETFRTRLRNERRVELCFEGHRFWDIRRWKIGECVKSIYGLDIVRDNDGSCNFDKVVVQNRKWEEKMNFFPIPNSEIYKNPNLNQNNGWN